MPYLFITNGTHAWQTAPSPHPNSRALKDGPGLRRTLLSETTRKLAVAVWIILRTRPAGNGPQCLTLLFEPTRKLAVFQPPTRLTNGALATAKQQGPEGRTGPAGNGPQCLTLLSEPTRKLAVFQPPRNSQTAPSPQRNSRALRDGPGLRATAPNVAFWTYKKTSCLPAAKKAHKRRPRHSETAGPWGTDRACGATAPSA